MATSTSCCLVLALLAAASAAAQQTGNLAFLAPVRQLPGLAKAGAHVLSSLCSATNDKQLANMQDMCCASL